MNGLKTHLMHLKPIEVQSAFVMNYVKVSTLESKGTHNKCNKPQRFKLRTEKWIK